jgi:hypothetical protein
MAENISRAMNMEKNSHAKWLASWDSCAFDARPSVAL